MPRRLDLAGFLGVTLVLFLALPLVTLVFLFALPFVPVTVVLAILLVSVGTLLFGLHAKPRLSGAACAPAMTLPPRSANSTAGIHQVPAATGR